MYSDTITNYLLKNEVSNLICVSQYQCNLITFRYLNTKYAIKDKMRQDFYFSVFCNTTEQWKSLEKKMGRPRFLASKTVSTQYICKEKLAFH